MITTYAPLGGGAAMTTHRPVMLLASPYVEAGRRDVFGAFEPGTRVLPDGFGKQARDQLLLVEIVLDKDIAVTLRTASPSTSTSSACRRRRVWRGAGTARAAGTTPATSASRARVTGVVSEVGGRRLFVDTVGIHTGSTARWLSARLDLCEFERHDVEVLLRRGIIGHRLIDTLDDRSRICGAVGLVRRSAPTRSV